MTDAITPLDGHLGYRLRLVSNAVSRSFARKVEASGVTVAEWVLLRVLHDGDGLSPSEVAERMGMTRGAISKLAERTIAKGLVDRRLSDSDRRAQRLTLTPAGAALVPVLAGLADANDRDFFSLLDASERAELGRLIGRIIDTHQLVGAAID